ncbi:hypothetical protein J4401_01980 [Candidatus Woesearchaeota archaeon]|nr:hypothetical protein [Candidatus Woesearchaeota archaeon]
MGHKNTSSLAFEVEKQLAGDYNISGHGDIGAFYMSAARADLPAYTAMAYHPTQHEVLSNFRYGRVEVGYEKGLINTREAVKGIPFEAYMPVSVVTPDGVGRNKQVEKDPKKVSDEIIIAIAEIMMKDKKTKSVKKSGKPY